MESRQLIHVALRVLKAWTIGDILAGDDLRSLRATALSDEADLSLG
jgi:hypothetical protein